MDLSTTYMGLELKNPLVASSSPLTGKVDSVRALEDAGIAAVVMHSLFEEQIRHEARELDYFFEHGAERFAESLTYFPTEQEFRYGPEQYLEMIGKLRRAVDIPVIASLNGVSAEGLMDYARKIEQAGAHGLEMNIYFLPTDVNVDARQVEDVYTSVVQLVKQSVSIPVAMKLSPYFSATANMASELADAGADALVLFNRFYQPDIDVKNLEVTPDLILSESAENRLPLRWIAILYGKIEASLAATTGVHTGLDAAKMILAGADAVMMASALLKNGPKHVGTVRAALVEIMENKEYESVSQMKGVLSQQRCAEPAAFERANYMRTLQTYVQTGTFE